MRRFWRDSWPAIALVLGIAIVIVLCLMAGSSAGSDRAGQPSGAAKVIVAKGSVRSVYPARTGLYLAIAAGRIYYLGRSTADDPSGPLMSVPVPARCF